MTFQEFEKLLHSVKPGATAAPHGAYRNGSTKQCVSIKFTPDGKLYDYRGSYAEILAKFGCEPQWYAYNHTGECIAREWSEEEARRKSQKWLDDYESHRPSWGGKTPGQYRIRRWSIAQLNSSAPFDPRTLFQ